MTMIQRNKITLGNIIIGVILALFFLWSVIPVLIVITNSFKETLDIVKFPPVFIFEPTIKHYFNALTVGDFSLYFKNSFIIAGFTTLISIGCGSMAAYGILIMKSRFGDYASSYLLIGRLVPAITILIPFFSIMTMMGLNRTYIGPILAHCSINLPFVTWLLMGFMRAIPKEIFESAMIDGASRMRAFIQILFPLLLPAIGSSLILSMQYSWNELLFSLQLTSMNSYTLPVGIAKFVGSISVEWGRGCAAATMTMVPIIILGFIMQKYLVAGMTAGSVKE